MNKFLLSTLFVLVPLSPRTAESTQLSFPVSANNIQILPQRFEYGLVSEEQLQIGNVLIDTTELKFHIERSKKNENSYDLHFQWPAGLLKQGMLAIKNSSGKAIIMAPIHKSDLKITNPITQSMINERLEKEKELRSQGIEPEENLEHYFRSEQAQFLVPNILTETIEALKQTPFLTFCIYSVEENTKVNLCSNLLHIQQQANILSVKNRSSNRTQSTFRINGKMVGEQGIIFLNDKKSENISIRAATKLGASLEIETRKKNVDFEDVYLSENEKNIIITATGAEPVDEKGVKKLPDGRWQTELSISRPFIYLKADGDIPIRQEFYVRGKVPLNNYRPTLKNSFTATTYSASQTTVVLPSENTKISVPARDPKSYITGDNPKELLWTTEELPSGVEEKRYLQVNTPDGPFYAAMTVFRGQPIRVNLQGSYESNSSKLFVAGSFQWWVERALLLESSFAKFHWGGEVIFSEDFSEKSSLKKQSTMVLNLKWRANQGLNMRDPTWGVNLGIFNLKFENTIFSSPGAGVFYIGNAKDWLLSMADWFETSGNIYTGSKSGEFSLDSIMTIEGSLYKRMTPNIWFNYGLGYRMISSADLDSLSSANLKLGLTLSF